MAKTKANPEVAVPAGPPPEEQLTITQVSERTTWSRSFIYSLMDRGELAYVRAGRTRRIPLAALREYIEKNTVKSRES